LLAEFLGLNEQETGESLVEVAPSQAELADLYEGPEACVFIQDGKQYLNGTKALASCPLIRNRILEANPDGATRMRQSIQRQHQVFYRGTWRVVRGQLIHDLISLEYSSLYPCSFRMV
jgi:hypothetical protein